MKFTSSLIIATYNWPDALTVCLTSVQQQTVLPDEIIIADDGSTHDTKTLVNDFKKKFTVPLHHVWHEDKGFRLSVIRNKAAAASKADYIIQLDGDIILHHDFVKDHLRAAKKQHFIGGSRVIIDEHLTNKIISEKKIPSSYFFNKSTRNKLNSLRIPFVSSVLSSFISPDKIENIRGCNMSFWKKDFIAVNGYDEMFLGWGREDSDLVTRFFKSGLKRTFFKFRGIVYHLYHNENDRSMLEINDALLEKTLKNKNFRCEKGIDQYF